MKVETSTVTKLVISDVPRLDPVTVFAEDLGTRECPIDSDPNYRTGQGKITISCSGESWTAYWGSMGPRTVAQFFMECEPSYIINCVSRGISSTRFSWKALIKLARRCVLDRRIGRNHGEWCMPGLDRREARELYDCCDQLEHIESLNEIHYHSGLLIALFGEEYWYKASEATEPNPDYAYLERIVEAVQAAFRQQAQEVAA